VREVPNDYVWVFAGGIAPNDFLKGIGIQFGPNVFHVFDRIGVTEEVQAVADMPRGVAMLDALTGAELARLPTGASFRARFKYPYIIVHRVDVHNVLLDACRRNGAIDLVPEAMMTGFEDRGDHVAVTTADGRTFDGAALIGADGLGSRTRAQLLNEDAPRLNGYVAHRTIVPMAAVPDGVLRNEVVLWGGPGHHIVHYPLRHGTLFNIVAVFRTATFAEKGNPAAYRAESEKAYRAAHPAMKALLAMMDLDRRWALSDRDPIRHWSRGRVALLGDAAHPTLQSLAQGACMAIEDGLCLANLIHLAGDDFANAFRQYEQVRLLRTARVTFDSRLLWEFYHAGEIERDVRNQTASEWTEDSMFRCLAWLYDGFAFPPELAHQ